MRRGPPATSEVYGQPEVVEAGASKSPSVSRTDRSKVGALHSHASGT